MRDVAAAKARRAAFQRDLANAYTDEEACPPEWADLLTQIDVERGDLRNYVDAECHAFRSEADITVALARRDRAVTRATDRVRAVNELVKRLNLIAPHGRFHRSQLDRDEVVKPLYRTARA